MQNQCTSNDKITAVWYNTTRPMQKTDLTCSLKFHKNTMAFQNIQEIKTIKLGQIFCFRLCLYPIFTFLKQLH